MGEDTEKIIAIIGGTGKEGKGLAYKWGKAGYQVIIGSRDPSKAEETARTLKTKLPNKASISGSSNEAAAQKCQIAVLTIPYSAHLDMIETLKDILRDKIVIDVTVPLSPSKVTRVKMPPAGSAAQETYEILGENAILAAAFHNISYENLINDGESNCDVLVTGTNKEARITTLRLVKDAGFIGWDAGPIENSVVLEGLTSVLIGINRQFKTTHAGIRITGVDREE